MIFINLFFLTSIYYQKRRLQLFASSTSRFKIIIFSILSSILSRIINQYVLDFEQLDLFSFFKIIILVFLKNFEQYSRLKQAQNSLIRKFIIYGAIYLRNLLEIPKISKTLSTIGYIIALITSSLLILSSIDTSIRYYISRISSRLTARVDRNSTLRKTLTFPSKLIYLIPL